MNSGYFSSSLWPERGLLVHGGVASPSSKTPQNSLDLLPLTNLNKPQVLDQKGPSLSHHSSCIVTFNNQDILCDNFQPNVKNTAITKSINH